MCWFVFEYVDKMCVLRGALALALTLIVNKYEIAVYTEEDTMIVGSSLRTPAFFVPLSSYWTLDRVNICPP